MEISSLECMNLEKFDNVDADVYDKTRQSAYEVINNLNTKLSKVTGSHNTTTSGYNQQNETLIKSQKYIDIQNDRLEKQRGNLQHIESTINTKTRLLTDYNKSSNKKDFHIYLLKVTIGFILLIVMKNMLMKLFNVLPNHKKMVFAILIFAYIAYVMYLYREYNLEGSYSSAKRDAHKMAQKSVDELNKQYKDYVDYKHSETDHLQNVCGCAPPDDEEHKPEEDEEEYIATGSSNNGYYYKDTTSPKRRIQPPVKDGATNANYEVVYTDRDNSEGSYRGGYPNKYDAEEAPHYYTLGL
jgi:hypothetical protein